MQSIHSQPLTKPLADYAGWGTHDLTMGLVHRVFDEHGRTRFIVRFPKSWEPLGEPAMQHGINGQELPVQHYRVLSWEERELVLFPCTDKAPCGGTSCQFAEPPPPKPERKSLWSRLVRRK